MGDLRSIPGLGWSPGEGKGYPLQDSGLENFVGCIVHESGVTKSQTRLNDFHFTSLHFGVFGASPIYTVPLICCFSRPFTLRTSLLSLLGAHLIFKCPSLRSAWWLHPYCLWCRWNMSSVKVSQPCWIRAYHPFLHITSVAGVMLDRCWHSSDETLADFIDLSVFPTRLWSSWGQGPCLHHLCILSVQLSTSVCF